MADSCSGEVGDEDDIEAGLAASGGDDVNAEEGKAGEGDLVSGAVFGARAVAE